MGQRTVSPAQFGALLTLPHSAYAAVLKVIQEAPANLFSLRRQRRHDVFRVVGLGGNCNRRKFVCARRVLRLCPESPSWHLRNSKLPGSQRDNHFHDNIAGCSMFYYSLQKYIYYATCDMSPILLVSGLLAIYS